MQNKPGAVVQLVRISACHAGGRGFESRPHRRRVPQAWDSFFVHIVQKAQTLLYGDAVNLYRWLSLSKPPI